MAITSTEQTSILNLVVSMFNAAPGAANLTSIAASFEANGRSLTTLANNLAMSSAFNDQFAGLVTNDAVATKMAANFGLTTGTAYTNAVNYFTAQLAAGNSKASIMKAANDYLLSTTKDAMFNDAGLALANKTTVAYDYSVTKQLSGATFAALQNVVASVTSSAASVTAATTGTGTTFALTTGTDSVTATSGNDIIDASGFFNAPTGAYIQTLTNGDSINGGAGTDTLNVILNTATATTLPTALTSIEVINLTNTVGTNVLDLANATGVTTLNSVNSATQIAQFNNVQSAPTNFGLTNTAVGMTVNVANAALAGTTDTATLTLQSVTAGVVTLQTVTAASGYETLNVVSNGTTANVLTTLTDGTGTSLATINVTGTAAINLGGALDASVTTVDASAMTAVVTVNASAAANVKVTTGSANDIITYGAAYTTADTINGGAGTDTLSIISGMIGGVTTAQTNVTNIETISISDATTAVAYDLTKWNGATNLVMAAASNAATTITYAAGTAGLTYGAVIDTGIQALTSSGTATNDVLNLTVGTTAAGVLETSQTTTSGFETINILAQGGTDSLGAVTMASTAATETINITGTQALTLGIVTADKIDASAFTGALSMVTGTVAAGGINITGGSAADTLWGSAAADIINGGAGADTIYNEATGVTASKGDILTGGAGFDTFVLYGDSASAANYSASSNITDFTVGTTTTTTDFLKLSSTKTNYSGSATNFGGGVATAVAGATTIQTVAKDAAAVVYTATADMIKLSTAVAFTTDLQGTFNAAIGTATVTGLNASEEMFASFYDTTNSQMVVVIVDSVTAGATTAIGTGDAVTLVGTLSMSAADYANFSANSLVIA